MAFVSFLNTAYVELVFQQHQQTVQNTLYFRGDNAWASGTLGQLNQELYDWWYDNMRIVQSDTVTLNTIRSRDMSSEFSYNAEETPLTGNVGTLTSPALPNNVTVAIKFVTALVGRRNRGRNFFVGLTEGQVAGNEIDATALGLIVDAYEDLGTYVTVNGAIHVVASRAAAVSPDYNGITTPVVSYAADGFVDSQRRRLSGRGS